MTAQFYSKEGTCQVFRRDNSRLLTIEAPIGGVLSRREAARILGLFGFRLGRWKRTDWDWEAMASYSNLERALLRGGG